MTQKIAPMTRQEILQKLENDRELWDRIDRSVDELCRCPRKRAALIRVAAQDAAVRRMIQHSDALAAQTPADLALANFLYHLTSRVSDGISMQIYELGLCHEMLAYAAWDFAGKPAETVREEIREELIASNLQWADKPIILGPHWRTYDHFGFDKAGNRVVLRVCEAYRRSLPDGAVRQDLAVCMALVRRYHADLLKRPYHTNRREKPGEGLYMTQKIAPMTQQEIRQALENDRELWDRIDRSVDELCRCPQKRAALAQLAEQDDAVCRMIQHSYRLAAQTPADMALATYLHHMIGPACDEISMQIDELGLCHEMLAYAAWDFAGKPAETVRAEIREELIASNLQWAKKPVLLPPAVLKEALGRDKYLYRTALRICEVYRRSLPAGAVRQDLSVCMALVRRNLAPLLKK